MEYATRARLKIERGSREPRGLPTVCNETYFCVADEPIRNVNVYGTELVEFLLPHSL